MEIKLIFNPNCSEWNEEVGGYYDEDYKEDFEEVMGEIEERSEREDWDANSNRSESELLGGYAPNQDRENSKRNDP